MTKYLDYEGLRYLWPKIVSKISPQKRGYLNITLSTNQDTPVNTSITVIINEVEHIYEYNNKSLTIIVPDKTTYKIIFNEYEQYTAPDPISGVVEAGATINISAQYKACLLSFKFSPKNASAIVSYRGELYTVQNSAKLLVPYEMVTITPNDMEMLSNPSVHSFTPDKPSQIIELDWGNIFPGVYIKDINGNLHTISSYESTNNVDCIVIITDAHAFGIAKEGYMENAAILENGNKKNPSLINVNYDEILPTFTGAFIRTANEALIDYNGYGNTSHLYNSFKEWAGSKIDSMSAVGIAKKYKFPSGENGYIGAIGEINIVNENLSTVNEAIAKVGGKTIPYDIELNSSSLYWKGDWEKWYDLYAWYPSINNSNLIIRTEPVGNMSKPMMIFCRVDI